MFSINTLYTKSSIVVNVNHNKDNIDFTISTIISKRNEKELKDPRQFELLNSYLDYKGPEYKDKLFKAYIKTHTDIQDLIWEGPVRSLPVHIVNEVLDLFDLNDIVHYLKNVYRLPPPSNLKEEFDPLVEQNSQGTRVQTYIINDYLELAALVLVIKAIIGPIGQYAYIKAKEMTSIHKEYILLQFLRQHPIFNSPPAEKLLGLIDKVVNLPTNSKETDDIRVLQKQLSKEAISEGVMAVVVIQKLPLCCIVDDNKDKNIVTIVYNYVNNKLKAPGDSTKSIKPKTNLTDTESGTGDKESIIESTRISSNLNTATPTEISWSVDSIEKIMHQLPNYMKDKIDMNIVKDSYEFCQSFQNGNLNKIQVQLVGFLFKDIIDPRALDHINIGCLINLFAVGFAYLWGTDFKHLALVLVSQPNVIDNEDSITINSTVNRTRIPKELKDELQELYPYNRVINETTRANTVEENITTLVNEFYNIRWKHTAYEKYIVEVLEDLNPSKILPIDLKLQLAKLFIEHERRRYVDV